MVYFDPTKRVFHLRTNHSSYCFGPLTDQVLVHLYWGSGWRRSPAFSKQCRLDRTPVSRQT